LPRCVGTVTRADARGRRYEFYVIGTVHAPGCASAEEVREVIERVRPDAVVLELDQERLDITVANAMVATSAEYGADFLAGAVAAEKLGALVVLGDAKARSLPELARAKLFTSPADLADLPRLWRSLAYLGKALGVNGELFDDVARRDAPRYVRFAEALAADPGKLQPLRAPAFLAALALLASARDAAAHALAQTPDTLGAPPALFAAIAVTVPAPSPADAAAAAFAALVVGRATEVLLESRDFVLARSAARSAAIAAALDRDQLCRVEHAFSEDAATTGSRSRPPSTSEDVSGFETKTDAFGSFPCFAVRRPLGAGETRRLNLFEPRWLAMIDAEAERRGGDPVGAEIACALGVNRRTVDSRWLRGARSGEGKADESTPDGDDGSTSRSRSAHLVIEPVVRLAEIVRVVEGTRAVTGSRKLEVFIKGRDETRSVVNFDPHPAGYLRATVRSVRTRNTMETKRRVDESSLRPVRVVCVVGLAHCNGVLSRLENADVETYR
jgi:hypothetical protein